jgi:hypothetical protein
MANTRTANAVRLEFAPGPPGSEQPVWCGLARRSRAAARDPVRFEAALTESVSLPHGRGTNRAEAVCDLPPALAGRKPRWLVLYDAPRADRRDGEHTAFGDLLRRD